MIEVPSAAIMADTLAEAADFFSIGTNDLVQYVLAADRTNSELADLASALQPAVLRLIDGVVRAARVRGRHVAVCGEAAADPAVIPFLVGLGVTELSVGPGSVAAVRSLVAGLDVGACRGAGGAGTGGGLARGGPEPRGGASGRMAGATAWPNTSTKRRSSSPTARIRGPSVARSPLRCAARGITSRHAGGRTTRTSPPPANVTW